MIKILGILKGAGSWISKNVTLFLIILCMAFMALFLQQCGKTKAAQAQTHQVTNIANENLKAMKDSSIQLKLTRTQLADADQNLSAKVKLMDSLIKAQYGKKDQVVEVIQGAPVVVQRDMKVNNFVRVDPTDPAKHILTFAVDDSVKSFDVAAAFYINKKDSTIYVLPGSTDINNFKLNFEFAVVKYDDPLAKVTKYKIVPLYTDKSGKTSIISDKTLVFNFRGVDLLDRPWELNNNDPAEVKKKLRVVGRWGLGLNPIGVGPIMNGNGIKFGYSPSISIGYFLTLEKR